MAQQASKETKPWWRFPIMWLVVGGPLAVVIAGVSTLLIAMKHPDPVLTGDYYRAPPAEGGEDGARPAEKVGEQHVPAMQARNHAATPLKPVSAAASTAL